MQSHTNFLTPLKRRRTSRKLRSPRRALASPTPEDTTNSTCDSDGSDVSDFSESRPFTTPKVPKHVTLSIYTEYITADGSIFPELMKKRDGHWIYLYVKTDGKWYPHPRWWLNEEDDDNPTNELARPSEHPPRKSLSPPLSKACRTRHHRSNYVDKTVSPDDFLRLVEAGARMVAQILERQVSEPTAQQDVADLLWDKNRRIVSQPYQTAIDFPLANYDDVPWPTVQINDTTYCFDRWAVNEYTWGSCANSRDLNNLFREVSHHAAEYSPTVQTDGRLCNLAHWEHLLHADLHRPDHVQFCPSDELRKGPASNMLGPHAPVVEPDLFKRRYCKGKRRVFLVDSGASHNTLKDQQARTAFEQWIVDLPDAVTLETANKDVGAYQGIKARVAAWDVPAEYLLVNESPELISLGERCTQWGFIFLWNGPKQPIFISPDYQYIIILDVDHSVPIWGPYME